MLHRMSLPSQANPAWQTPSLFLSRQAPVWMRLGAGQPSVELALLSRPGATSGATNKQGLFLFSFHDYMMQDCPATSWSIVTVLCFAPLLPR